MQVLRYIQRSLLAIALTLCTNLLYAQADIKVDITKNDGGGGGWYTNPIVWIVGAAVFILLLVALLRGRK